MAQPVAVRTALSARAVTAVRATAPPAKAHCAQHPRLPARDAGTAGVSAEAAASYAAGAKPTPVRSARWGGRRRTCASRRASTARYVNPCGSPRTARPSTSAPSTPLRSTEHTHAPTAKPRVLPKFTDTGPPQSKAFPALSDTHSPNSPAYPRSLRSPRPSRRPPPPAPSCAGPSPCTRRRSASWPSKTTPGVAAPPSLPCPPAPCPGQRMRRERDRDLLEPIRGACR